MFYTVYTFYAINVFYLLFAITVKKKLCLLCSRLAIFYFRVHHQDDTGHQVEDVVKNYLKSVSFQGQVRFVLIP